MKPWLLHNWPQSKIEHEEISVRIKKLFNEYQKYKISKQLVVKTHENDEEDLIDVCINSDNVQIIENDEESNNQNNLNYNLKFK